MNIDARELTLIYDCDKSAMTVAVDNLDITVHPNEQLGIMGPSGSGKSTLLYLLSGLKKPTSGSIFYDGRDILLLGEKEMNDVRRKEFGFIFQRHYLISHLTVAENILLPLKKISEQDTEYAQSLMNEINVWRYRNKMPCELSVGERQKVAILRALVNKPQVLFADEPTASLDIDSAMAVMELLSENMQGASIVVVTHDYKILKGADRIIHMRDGRIG